MLSLFLAGIVPGILPDLACAAVVFLREVKGGWPVATVSVTRGEVPRLVFDGLLVISLPAFVVIGTVSGGHRKVRRPQDR